MYRHYTKLIIAILVSSLMYFTTATQAAPFSEADAKSVVLRYLDALSQGDTQTIKQLLGDEILESKGIILDNPNYSNMLSKMYGLASYDVIGTSVVDEQNIAVDTVINLSPDERLNPRFILAADNGEDLKIVEEQESAEAGNY